MRIEAFGVEEWMNTYEDDAKYNIAETCVESLTVSELLEMAGETDTFFQKLAGTKLTYGAIPGSAALRDEICGLYHAPKTAENVIVTNGGIGANFLSLFTLVEPGDEVVAIYPTYQQLYSLPEAFGANVHRMRLTEETNFLPDMTQLASVVSRKTKLIVLNTPNNPTGALFSEKMLREIAAIADKVGAWVHVDEVYRGLEHKMSYKIPSITDIYERGVATSSMSKVYSLAGLRLGWVTGPKDFIADCFKHRDYNIISCGMIDDALATMALRNRDKILARNLAIVNENVEILADWVEKTAGVSFVKPVSGTTALIKYETDMDSEAFCKKMFDYNGAFVVPGSCFEFEKHFRIGYAPKAEVLREGLAAISDFMKTL